MLLFLDESGIDEKVAPCVVLGGVSISEQNLWQFEQAVKALEREMFGLELSEVGIEIKGKRLLKTKTFRHAGQGPPLEEGTRMQLARSFLRKGFQEKQTNAYVARCRDEYTAYGQAAIAFVGRLLEVAAVHGVKTFASIVKRGSPQPSDPSALRKDYSYLLERYFYFLETLSPAERGLIICDELEVSQSQVIIAQMAKYFQVTMRGQVRSNRIVPVPFFVHSHLTTAIQLADLVCYIINWAVRIPKMTERTRPELEPLGNKVNELQFFATRYDEMEGRNWPAFGICYIEDLRSAAERGIK